MRTQNIVASKISQKKLLFTVTIIPQTCTVDTFFNVTVVVKHIYSPVASCTTPTAISNVDPPPAVPSPMPWPSTFRAFLPFNLKNPSMFFTQTDFHVIYFFIFCIGIGETADLSAQLKCHPLLSALHPCPFTVSCGLCVSRTSKKGNMTFVFFEVCFPQ